MWCVISPPTYWVFQRDVPLSDVLFLKKIKCFLLLASQWVPLESWFALSVCGKSNELSLTLSLFFTLGHIKSKSLSALSCFPGNSFVFPVTKNPFPFVNSKEAKIPVPSCFLFPALTRSEIKQQNFCISVSSYMAWGIAQSFCWVLLHISCISHIIVIILYGRQKYKDKW